MKKRLLSLILLLPFLSFLSPGVDPTPLSARQKSLIKTIIIDPGHGGSDPGARGLHSTEAAVALEVAMKFGKKIEEEFPNIKIVYTRTSDILPGNRADTKDALKYRADLANESKGDLFISIHCNSTKKAGGWNEKRLDGYKIVSRYKGKGKRRKKVKESVATYKNVYVKNLTKGTETYIWAADRTDAKGSFVNERMAEDDSSAYAPDLNDTEFKAKALLWTKKFFDKSLKLATFVEEEYQKSGREYRGGVKQRNDKGIWVLQATGMPSILTEIGFITNEEEEAYLNSEKGQNEIAENLLAAFKRYKKEVEGSAKTK